MAIPRIHDKVRVRILERSFPEVTNARLNYWALIRNGDLLPLDEFLDQPSWEGDRTWRESFLPGTLSQYTHEGKTYGVPLMASAYAVWYNRDLFEEHGWQPARTWDEFFDLCERIKAAGEWPLAFQGRYPGYVQSVIDHAYYHLAGPQRYDDQKNLLPGSFDNPEFAEALSIAQRIALNYFQPGALGMSHTESQLEFFLGHTAMIFCGSWLKSEMLGKIPDGFRLGSFNLPVAHSGKADPSAVYGGSGYYFVMKGSDNPLAGVEFLRFMTSRRMAGRFCRMRDIPVSVAGVSEENLSEDMADLAAMLKNAAVTYGTPPGEGLSGHDAVLDRHPVQGDHRADYTGGSRRGTRSQRGPGTPPDPVAGRDQHPAYMETQPADRPHGPGRDLLVGHHLQALQGQAPRGNQYHGGPALSAPDRPDHPPSRPPCCCTRCS